MRPIDYSQYKAYKKCPLYWLERYVVGTRHPPHPMGSSSALTLGTLVHEGLAEYNRSGTGLIHPNVVKDSNASPECVGLAGQLVREYMGSQPSEPIPLVTIPTVESYISKDGIGAKLDMWCELSEPVIINGQRLSPGVWAFEYKTKNMSINRWNWLARWNSCMQADFQILTLEQHLGRTVNGVVVSVIEYKEPAVPKRKCKTCAVQYDFADWIGTGETDMYKCPICGNVQKLMKAKPTGGLETHVFRHGIYRSCEEKMRAWTEIQRVRQEMDVLVDKFVGGAELAELPYNPEECYDTIFGACDYANAHTTGKMAKTLVPLYEIVSDPLGYQRR